MVFLKGLFFWSYILIYFFAVSFFIGLKIVIPIWWRVPVLPFLKVSAESYAKSDQCDNSLWQHVYLPQRFEILDDCVSLPATVSQIFIRPDGDAHVEVKLDKNYSNLINISNKLLRRGDLVGEVVCLNSEKLDKEVKDVCQNYQSQIKLPEVGQKVRVTGSLVIDKTFGWVEIHPVSKIERL